MQGMRMGENEKWTRGRKDNGVKRRRFEVYKHCVTPYSIETNSKVNSEREIKHRFS